MKLPEFGVKRPIATAMLFIAIIMIGLVSLKILPLDIMPEMEFPSLTVITVYPGASANEVEEQVTKPLETVLSAAEHLKEITSSSKENVSFIKMRYDWGNDVTSAANNARDLMELAKSRLPAGAHTPVIYKINSSMMPILTYGVNAQESYAGIEHILEDKIASPLKKIDGVGTIIYLGYPEREIHISVNPEQLAAYRLSVQQIATILKAENISIPGGNIKVGVYDFSVRVPGKFDSVEQIKNTVITAIGGKVVRLRDVAEVNDSFAETDSFARNHKGRGVALMVQKQSGTNTLEVVNAVRAKMKELEKDLPADMEFHEIISTDEIITESVSNLSSSIWYALVFVTLVVLFFLREWKSSLIIFIVMPVSLISAFITMYILNYSINIFSLMSLVIAIGMVVDNAIVVLENITQHIEKGSKPKQAAIFGTSEMGMAIAASTATTLVIFLPMLFMGGIVGIMFKQLAVITSVCLIMSLFTALTLTPMLSSRLLKPITKEGKKQSKFYRASEKIFVKVENGYRTVLAWAVFHKKITLTAAVLVFVVTIFLGRQIGTDYIPEFDAGDVTVMFETEVGTSANVTDSIAQQILSIVREEVHELTPGGIAAVSGQTKDGALTTVGFSEGKNVGTVICHLNLPNERARSAKEIGDALEKRIENIPEIEKLRIQAGSILSMAITGNKRPIELHVSGKDFEKINNTARLLQQKMKESGAFSGVETSIDRGKLEVQIEVDKDKASQMALNTSLIGMQIRQNLYGTDAGEFTEQGNDYSIRIQYGPEYRNDIEKLNQMRITNLLGQQIPLSTVANVSESFGLNEIQHQSQQRFVMTSAGLNNVSLGEGHHIAQQILNETDIPEGVEVTIGGQVTEQGQSFGDLYLILFLGIALVYMVMAAQFESFKDPFIILFAIPFTIVGVIWGFFLTGLTLSITTFIGIIMLVGIVVNNGIVLVDYTNMLRKRNYLLRDAIMEAGRSRLRPVLMTTFTTILGMLPMAMRSGMGREAYSPLAITIIFGLLISMLVTLILVPTIYTLLSHKVLISDREKVRKKRNQTITN